MTLSELLRAVFVHLLTPVAGLSAYVWFCRKMKKARIPSPPFLGYFILFFTLGGWLMVALTLLLWQPSGMFLVGMLYLVFVAPIVTAAVAVGARQERSLSVYHRRAYQVSMGYSVVLIVAVAGWFSIHWAYQRS